MKIFILSTSEEYDMKSKTPKVLHKILDKPMIFYTIENARKIGANEIIVISSEKNVEIKQVLENHVSKIIEVDDSTSIQGIMATQNNFGEDDKVLILFGDIPLISERNLKELVKKHIEENNGLTILSALNPKGINSEKSIEITHCCEKFMDSNGDSECEQEIKTSLACAFLFNASTLNLAISKLKEENSTQKYSIKKVIEILLKNNELVGTFSADNWNELFEINNRIDLANASSILQDRINTFHMLNGVTILNPQNTYIGSSVTIGTDSIIYPGTILEGETEIGESCFIGKDCTLTNMKVGNHTHIEYSVLKNSAIGTNTSVGPFAYVRPNCQIGSNCKIGDFVEVKNSIIGDKTKASHLTYVGDSDVGSNVNFGCGTVTVNYDGKSKYKTVIKDRVFIGCNTNLVAPVTIYEDSFIAAGSTITDDVPKKSLSLARARQVNKEGWTLEK